jgi:hypothetical protein
MTPTGSQKPSMPASWRRHNGVPRFFLNLRYRDRLFVDEEGMNSPMSMPCKATLWKPLAT